MTPITANDLGCSPADVVESSLIPFISGGGTHLFDDDGLSGGLWPLYASMFLPSSEPLEEIYSRIGDVVDK